MQKKKNFFGEMREVDTSLCWNMKKFFASKQQSYGLVD